MRKLVVMLVIFLMSDSLLILKLGLLLGWLCSHELSVSYPPKTLDKDFLVHTNMMDAICEEP